MCDCNIRFYDLNWEIHFVEQGCPELLDNGDDPMGITHFDKLKTYIRISGISPDMLERVCRHEAVHMALYSYGLDKDSYTEEEMANFFECYGVEILRNAEYMARKAFSAFTDRKKVA